MEHQLHEDMQRLKATMDEAHNLSRVSDNNPVDQESMADGDIELF